VRILDKITRGKGEPLICARQEEEPREGIAWVVWWVMGEHPSYPRLSGNARAKNVCDGSPDVKESLRAKSENACTVLEQSSVGYAA